MKWRAGSTGWIIGRRAVAGSKLVAKVRVPTRPMLVIVRPPHSTTPHRSIPISSLRINLLSPQPFQVPFRTSSEGKYDEAEPIHRQTLALMEKVMGKEHPDTLTSMNNLAGLQNSQGKYNEAEPCADTHSL